METINQAKNLRCVCVEIAKDISKRTYENENATSISDIYPLTADEIKELQALRKKCDMFRRIVDDINIELEDRLEN